MSNIDIQIQGDQAIQAKFNSMSEGIRKALIKKITVLTLKLESKIIIEKLSGQILKVRSGDLRRSIFQKVLQNATSVDGQVYSAGVNYARIHEFGGKTAPHLIEPKSADGVLAFSVGGKTVFAKSVNHPGSLMPERSYMRSSLKEMSSEIINEINVAVKEGTL